ncbi:MAG TPA: 5'-3'-deoxyribonucleotidase [Candidatus Paceibacterota bacterium]|nr:5'-3'-deoxyribonucleotidase [Candidatus Paceibacterota bacterium]
MNTTDPLTILVDMDGVLCDYAGAHMTKVAERYPHLTPYIGQAQQFWSSELAFPEEHREAIEAIALEPGFFENLAPIDGAIEALQALVAKGHNVRICTAPKKIHTYCVPEKYNWVRNHLGQAFVERVIMTRDKTLTHGDLLIDDKPVITGAVKPRWEHIVFNQPYNKEVPNRRIDWSNYKDVLGV